MSNGDEKAPAPPNPRHRSSILNFTAPQPKPQGTPTVVVIGGGFCGLHCCRLLRHKFKVTLVDAKEYFEYYPGILRAYLHPHEHRLLSNLYQPICDEMGVTFVWGEVTRMDPMSKRVYAKPVFVDHEKVITFDYCVVTTGSQYGIYMNVATGVNAPSECLWYPTFLEKVIKTQSVWGELDERFLAGRRQHFERELAVLQQLSQDKGTVVIAGAGFIGVEWATDLKYAFPDINVVIVESRGECIGVMPKKCKDYCQKYMDDAGIITVYNLKYDCIMACPENGGKCKIHPSLAAKGVSQIDRIYMAVGVRSINQFMPVECLDDMKYDKGTGDVTRGGWMVCNSQMRVLSKGETPIANGCVYTAGNCCSVQGLNMPKNSCPGEEMGSIACNNIMAMDAKARPAEYGGCFGFFIPKLKEVHWSFTMGICATSLGPWDATMVIESKEPGSGYTVLTGQLAAMQKEFIRWSKVDQCRMGCVGRAIFGLLH